MPDSQTDSAPGDENDAETHCALPWVDAATRTTPYGVIDDGVLRIPPVKTVYQRVKEAHSAPEHFFESHCLNGLCGIRRAVRATVKPLVCVTCGSPVIASDQGPVR